MNIKKMGRIIVGLLSLAMLLSVGITQAQAVTYAPVYQVSVVNVYVPGAAVSGGDTVTGSFVIDNETNPVDFSDVYYNVSLVGDFDTNNFPQTRYEHTDNIGPIFVKANEKKQVSFTYTLPKTLPGTNLGLEVTAVSATGRVYGWGDVKLALSNAAISAAKYVEMKDALLYVGSGSYYPQLGPTVHTGEKATLGISLYNPNKSTMTLIPKLKVYNRVVSGSSLLDQTLDSFTIAAGANKIVKYELPLFNNDPKVYAGTIEFVDTKGEQQSAALEFRYIVQGTIVTIQSVVLSTSTGATSEPVHVTVVSTGAPDDISSKNRTDQGTGTLTITLADQDGKVVGKKESSISLNGVQQTQVEITPSQNVSTAFKATATITKDGKTLATYSSNMIPVIAKPGLFTSGNAWMLSLLGVIAVIIFWIGFFIIWKRSHRKPQGMIMGLLIAAIFGAGFLLPQITHAAVWQPTEIFADPSWNFDQNSVTVNLSAGQSLQPGQAFQLSFNVQAIACNNANSDVNVTVTPTFTNPATGKWYPIVSVDSTHTKSEVNASPLCTTSHCTPILSNNNMFIGNYTAPTTPGSYRFVFQVTNTLTGSWGTESGWIKGYVDFTVVGSVGNNPPIGTNDSLICTQVSGWSCDKDSPSTSNAVAIFRDGLAGQGGVFVANVNANQTRSDLLGACGSTNHGYTYSMPYQTGTHTFYFYGYNLKADGTSDGTSNLLANSGKTITCPVNSPYGYLDAADCTTGIAGWSCDADNFNQALDIHIYDGSTFVMSIPANQARPDLYNTSVTPNINACGGTTAHGFGITPANIPASLKDGKTHNISAYGINIGGNGQNQLLGNSPKQLTCPVNDPIGNQNSKDCTHITGWACDKDISSQQLTINILSPGSTIAATGVANLTPSNPDVVTLLCGGSAHGFDITVPASFKDGLTHGYSIQAKNIGVTGSDKIIATDSLSCGTPPPGPVNNAPSAPTITEPSVINQHVINVNYPFNFKATDPDVGDTLRYGIDWDKNGTVDEWIPSTGLVAQNVTQQQSHVWTTNGTKTIQALAEDSKGAQSGWGTYTFTVGNTPPGGTVSCKPTESKGGVPTDISQAGVGDQVTWVIVNPPAGATYSWQYNLVTGGPTLTTSSGGTASFSLNYQTIGVKNMKVTATWPGGNATGDCTYSPLPVSNNPVFIEL